MERWRHEKKRWKVEFEENGERRQATSRGEAWKHGKEELHSANDYAYERGVSGKRWKMQRKKGGVEDPVTTSVTSSLTKRAANDHHDTSLDHDHTLRGTKEDK